MADMTSSSVSMLYLILYLGIAFGNFFEILNRETWTVFDMRRE